IVAGLPQDMPTASFTVYARTAGSSVWTLVADAQGAGLATIAAGRMATRNRAAHAAPADQLKLELAFGAPLRPPPAPRLAVLPARPDRAGGKGGAAGARRQDLGAACDAMPRPAQGQEDHGRDRRAREQRHHQRAAAELRPALRRDQPAPARAGVAHLHARRNSPADRAGRDRRVFP